MLDLTHKVASVFSLETECGSKQIVPFKQAIMGDHNLIKAIPAKSQQCHILLLTQKQVVLHMTEVEGDNDAAKFKTLYVAQDNEYLLDIMTSEPGDATTLGTGAAGATSAPHSYLVILTNQSVI